MAGAEAAMVMVMVIAGLATTWVAGLTSRSSGQPTMMVDDDEIGSSRSSSAPPGPAGMAGDIMLPGSLERTIR
jgi:hypothetical protein